jgi:L-asparaginase
VLATMGAGSMSDETNKFLAHVTASSRIPVVYSKRSMDGMVPTGSLPKVVNNGERSIDFNNAIAGGYLNPQKARILLQLCLHNEMDLDEIKKVFKGVYGG